jgi:hypothetical protein
LLERVLNLKADVAYQKVKAALVEGGCKVTSEEEPRRVCFRQGSLWGISPVSAKKTIKLDFEAAEDKTKVRCCSMLASDWMNITFAGCGLAAVLVGFCIWMASDLSGATASGSAGFWGWFVTVDGNVDVVAAQTLARLAWGLTGFLCLVIVLEAAIVVYAKTKIDAFTQTVLEKIY